jgi:hypothetical protein
MNERDKKFARQAGLRTYQEKAPGLDGMVGSWESFEVLFFLIRADEREACAKVCDRIGNPSNFDYVGIGGVVCAESIRARGNTNG